MASPFCFVEGNLLFVNSILLGAWKNHLECLKAAAFLRYASDKHDKIFDQSSLL
jgi:hypothetical protein